MRPEHQPDPDFVQHLEWQVRSAARRAERFAQPTADRGRRAALARLRTAALAMLCLGLGAAGVVAAERIQDSRERALVLARVELEHELARARLARAQEVVERAELLVRGGRASETSSSAAAARRADAARGLERAQLDLEEVHTSGRAPRDELAAPLVAGRDFVGERLALDLRAAQEALVPHEARRARLETLHAAGVVSRADLDELEAEHLPHAERLRSLAERLDLRRRFVAGELDAVRVELLGAQAEALARFEHASAARELVAQRAAHVETLATSGRVSSAELAAARDALAEADGALRLAALELELIEERAGR